MTRKNPYSVPPNYFSDLQKQVIECARTVEQTPSEFDVAALDPELEEQSWGNAWRRLMGFAAAFAIMVAIGWLFVFIASDGKQAQDKQDLAVVDTARFLWVMSEDDVVEIIDHKKNEQKILAEAAVEYIGFFGEADDINLIYYD